MTGKAQTSVNLDVSGRMSADSQAVALLRSMVDIIFWFKADISRYATGYVFSVTGLAERVGISTCHA